MKRTRVGERHELVCGNVAHGGFVVARLEGVVVFVRFALPGETVEAVVTQGAEGDRFLRADAVRVIVASPDRVTPPALPANYCVLPATSRGETPNLRLNMVLKWAALLKPCSNAIDVIDWPARFASLS